MIVKTTRELRREIADWWALAARHAVAHHLPVGTYNPYARIDEADRLKALGDEPTLEQIAEIIGQKEACYHATLTCSECGEKVDTAIELDASDYLDPVICADCLRKALRLLGEGRAGHWTPQP